MTDAETLFRLAALNSEYASCIDADRLEEWPGLFLENCLYKITSADNHRRGYEAGIIYADSRAMLTDRVASLREANIYERQSYRHIIGMPAPRPGEAGRDHRRDAVPGGAHDARRADGPVRHRRLSRPRARGCRRPAALRPASGGVRQLALRHLAGDSAVGGARRSKPVRFHTEIAEGAQRATEKAKRISALRAKRHFILSQWPSVRPRCSLCGTCLACCPPLFSRRIPSQRPSRLGRPGIRAAGYLPDCPTTPAKPLAPRTPRPESPPPRRAICPTSRSTPSPGARSAPA